MFSCQKIRSVTAQSVVDDVSVKQTRVNHSRCEVTAVSSKVIHVETVGLLFLDVASTVSVRHVVASPQGARRTTVQSIKLLQSIYTVKQFNILETRQVYKCRCMIITSLTGLRCSLLQNSLIRRSCLILAATKHNFHFAAWIENGSTCSPDWTRRPLVIQLVSGEFSSLSGGSDGYFP